MGREWKVGDRVAVYGYTPKQYGGTTMRYRLGETGKVKAIAKSGDEVTVAYDNGFAAEAHPKQLRRLRKRERRRVWIQVAAFSSLGARSGMHPAELFSREPQNGPEWIEFTESPPRKAGAKERE